MLSRLSSEVSATRHYDGYHLDVMLYYTKVLSNPFDWCCTAHCDKRTRSAQCWKLSDLFIYNIGCTFQLAQLSSCPHRLCSAHSSLTTSWHPTQIGEAFDTTP